jgi:hypothetical protein
MIERGSVKRRQREADKGGTGNHAQPSARVPKSEVLFKFNGSAKSNMKLLKEGCYCHYHPHLTADVCNADFLRRVVSRNKEAGVDENDDLDALTPSWMVFMLCGHAFFFLLDAIPLRWPASHFTGPTAKSRHPSHPLNPPTLTLN